MKPSRAERTRAGGGRARQAKVLRSQSVEKAAKQCRRKLGMFDLAWRMYRQRMDDIDPGWDGDRLYVAKAKAVLRQEVNAKYHSDLVVVPNLS